MRKFTPHNSSCGASVCVRSRSWLPCTNKQISQSATVSTCIRAHVDICTQFSLGAFCWQQSILCLRDSVLFFFNFLLKTSVSSTPSSLNWDTRRLLGVALTRTMIRIANKLMRSIFCCERSFHYDLFWGEEFERRERVGCCCWLWSSFSDKNFLVHVRKYEMRVERGESENHNTTQLTQPTTAHTCHFIFISGAIK